MESLGNRIKQLRDQEQHPSRKVVSCLEIDQAILSKIEHGHHKATHGQVIKLAKYFKTDENDLIVLWLSDKVAFEILDEDLAQQALRIAEKRILYFQKNR